MVIIFQSLLQYELLHQIDYRMIHQAKITFHSHEFFHFMRKQDAQHYEVGVEHDLYLMVDRTHLSFLISNENLLCRAKTKVIDFNSGKKQPIQPSDKEITLYYIPAARKGEEAFHTPLATIKSSKAAIHDIKEVIDKNRKYKSCLSFVPSRVRHISILSGESPTQKFRGFINLAGVMFLILNIRNIIENFINYGFRFQEAPSQFLPLHFLLSTAALLLFPLAAFLLEKARFMKILPVLISKVLLVLNMVGLLWFNTMYCARFKPNPLLAILFTAMAVIILLKLISYYQVNEELYFIIAKMGGLSRNKKQDIKVEMLTHYEISQDNLDEILKHEKDWSEIVSLGALAYFLALPTLCYQLSYPKTSSIRWLWLAKRVIELFVMAGFQIILLLQYIEPGLNELLEAVHNPTTTWYQLFNRHLRLSIPNTVIWVAGFYSIFHLWFNIIGEVLHFGDRNFYRDWWNCRSIEEYWKTWNLPVHFWFIRHVYNPLLQLGCSRLSANLVVFFISAIAHEYLVSVPLGFISCWAFFAMMLQAPVIIIQRKLDKFLKIENSELSNVSFWIFFCIIGQPLVVFIYYAMYVDHTNNHTAKIPTFIPIQL